MALKRYLHLPILITILAGASSSLTWNPETRRYESYDLERGPVFYEAYYPDNSNQNNYQEKRYFDRGAVIERTFQVPSDHYGFSADTVPFSPYQEEPEQVRYADVHLPESIRRTSGFDNYLRSGPPSAQLQNYGLRDNREFLVEEPREESLSRSIGGQSASDSEASSLKGGNDGASETWNPYFRRYQDEPRYVRPNGGIERREVQGQPRRNLFVEGVRNDNARLTNPARFPGLGQSSTPRRVSPRDLDGRAFFNSNSLVDPLAYENRKFDYDDKKPLAGDRGFAGLPNPPVESLPAENIFMPRPQIINYVFSKRPTKKYADQGKKQPSKEYVEENTPRNYGDNLIQEEMKEANERKDGQDVKVTSIEVSEVPKHKTRHHHGEWPRRDYSKHARA